MAALMGGALLATSTVAVGQEKWAAIVGSSDRSAVGASWNQPSKSKAVSVATQQCRAKAQTAKSCDTVRSVWSGPACKSITTGSGQQRICNK
jgi:hypothetical protein